MIDQYLVVWWLNEIAQPLAIIGGVLLWIWDSGKGSNESDMTDWKILP